MSLLFKTGDLLKAGEPAIAHGVNCQGVMGAGIAKSIRAMYGEGMYQEYVSYCDGTLRPGGMAFWRPSGRPDLPYLYNLATQEFPGADATLGAVLRSVDIMLNHAKKEGIDRIGVPWIGCGIGGLDQRDVMPVLEAVSQDSPVDLIVYTLLED